jgi:hypothetical protein
MKNYQVEQHLRFIDVLAQYQGQVHHAPLVAYFALSTGTVTRLFREYKKRRPDNLVYCPVIRRYKKTDVFVPLFDNDIDDGE